MTFLHLIQLGLIFFFVLVCVIRLTEMNKATSELEAWGYILLSVGAVWISCGLVSYGKWILVFDDEINMDFAIILFLVGLNILAYIYVDPIHCIKTGNKIRGRRYTDNT